MKRKTVKKLIVFVCTGNTCRSPMAEATFKALANDLGLVKLKIRSAGVRAKKGDELNPKSALVLEEQGLSLPEFKPSRLTDAMLKQSLAVVCMTDAQRDLVMEMRWNALKKAGENEDDIQNNVYSFAELTGYEVMDPYGRDIDCYRYVYQLIDSGKAAVLEKLIPEDMREKYKEKVKKTATRKKKTDAEEKGE